MRSFRGDTSAVSSVPRLVRSFFSFFSRRGDGSMRSPFGDSGGGAEVGGATGVGSSAGPAAAVVDALSVVLRCGVVGEGRSADLLGVVVVAALSERPEFASLGGVWSEPTLELAVMVAERGDLTGVAGSLVVDTLISEPGRLPLRPVSACEVCDVHWRTSRRRARLGRSGARLILVLTGATATCT